MGGQAEITSSDDNKIATYALMDKIEFDRERYRLGHTLVFFRAGALAKLEEARDEIVMKLVRYIQGQAYQIIRHRTFAKKRDQRELLVVCQRRFRKFLQMRDWGWFVIIQKTRPLIGMPNPEEELRILEEKAKNTYGKYMEKKQGNLSQYHERQAKITVKKAELEQELIDAQNKLTETEEERQTVTAEKKELENECTVVKKDIEDLEIAIQKLEQEKATRDHIIKTLNDE